MSLVRRTVYPYRLMETDPMKAYAIACRYDWVEEAAVASTKTLSYDIADPSVSSSLEGIDGRHLLRLFQLHRARRDGMKKYMDDATIFNGGSLGCQCKAVKDATTWNTLKLRIRTELSEDPMGTPISNLEFTKWPECLAVENSKCECGESYYDIHRTCQRLRDGIDRLPKTVDEVSWPTSWKSQPQQNSDTPYS
jgi:hypothetical protein